MVLANHMLFGTTAQGGTSNEGVVFSMKADGSDYTVLHSFAGGALGFWPSTSPVPGPNGVLYGFTDYGGTYSQGLLYEVAADGTYSVLYNFSPGGVPTSLVADATGTLFGGLHSYACENDSSTTCGYTFQFSPSTGAFTLLTSFAGHFPSVSSIDSADNLYGITTPDSTRFAYQLFAAGSSGSGDPQILHRFAGNTKYGDVYSALQRNGAILGATEEAPGGGELFIYNRGAFDVLYRFPFKSGALYQPLDAPLRMKDGSLVGAAASGGLKSSGCSPFRTCGAIYRYLPDLPGSASNAPRPVQ
jgi:uncharacterized repeat protein (TIGR03803 family)